MKRLRNRLVKGTALNFIAVGFNQGSTLVINIIVARLLMKHCFGEYAMVYSTLLTVTAISQLAIGYTASKYIAEYRNSEPEKTRRIMGMLIIFSIITASFGGLLLLFIAPWLSRVMLNAPHLKNSLFIGSGFIFFSVINGYQLGALSGLEAYKGLAKSGAASGVVAIAIIALFTYFGGVNGSIWGISASSFVRCAIHNYWLQVEYRILNLKPNFKNSLNQEKSIIFKFAIPAAIAGLYMTPLVWIANSFLVRQPGGYGEMALYSAANNLRIAVLFLPNVINSVGLTLLNNEKSKGNINSYNRLFKTNVFYILSVALAGVIMIGAGGHQILQLFGKDFKAGYLLLWILLIASLFESLSTALYQYIQSKAKMWLSFFIITVPREALLVIFAFYLVPNYGGIGLAIAFLTSSIFALSANFSLVAVLYVK